MANLWEIVTGNSSLPVAPGNTFWDHLNNQQGGGNVYLTGGLDVSVELDETDVDMLLETIDVNVDFEEINTDVEFDDINIDIEIEDVNTDVE